ncbi:hypothetical protein QC764_500070 [Podospora pseudoanserina]|uniref:Uncharacterized protein n=1 Tax=Podospora pseudoanserina TaxID=2609844 RepID=A0ABR0I4D0_9PEZI|nr:hypothetical protein QC764_500070 [Podospora pseudoanserina]
MPSATLPAQTSTPVPLAPSQAKRLYGAIHLFCALNNALPHVSNPHTPDDDSIVTTPDDDRALYRCFVNKIAQICDTKHGGDTVTSAMIVQPGQVEYWIASNSRTKTQMAGVKKFLSDEILKVLGSMKGQDLEDEAKVKAVSDSLLKKVIAYCRWRLYKYLRTLVDNIGLCLESCAKDSGAEATMAGRLRELLPIAEAAVASWPHDLLSFTQETYRLLMALKKSHTSSFASFLRLKAPSSENVSKSSPENDSPASPWIKTRHAIGRLHSYTLAIRVFIVARGKWPDLFESPEVIPYPSPAKLPSPLQIKERMCTGKDLLNRLTTDVEVHDAYDFFSPQLQARDFDAGLKNSIKDPKYITTVHAEVTLLSNLRRETLCPSPGREDAHWDFFMEDKFGRYIGCSKPTCMLCDMYFDASPAKVDRRKGHGNLYHRWRVADIIQGSMVNGAVEMLVRERKNVIEEMIKTLKKEVTGLLVERRGWRGSRHDSRATPSDPFGSAVTAAGSVRGGLTEGRLMQAQAGLHGNMGSGSGSVQGRGRRGRLVLEEVEEVEDETDGDQGEYMEGESMEEVSRLMGQLSVTRGRKEEEDDDDDEGGAKL